MGKFLKVVMCCCVLLLAGCSLMGLSGKLDVPAFGSLQLDIGESRFDGECECQQAEEADAAEPEPEEEEPTE
jgi:hypothetical protein